MKQSASTKQTFSSSDRTKIALVSVFLATLLFTFGFLLGLVLRENGFRLSMLAPDLAEEEINTSTTPGASEIKAEVRLLDTTALEDGNTISIGVSIHNYGGAAFTLSANNVLLTQPNGRPLALLRIEPRLPKMIKPGGTETFDFTFRRPASQTARLKVFTVKYDIEGY